MTDLEMLKATLAQMGYKEIVAIDQFGIQNHKFRIGEPGRHGNKENGFDYHSTISLGRGIGYVGFCCDFYFDPQGKAITHGCWE